MGDDEKGKALTTAILSADSKATSEPEEKSITDRSIRTIEDKYSGLTFEEIDSMTIPDAPRVQANKTELWKQKLRLLCDPRIIKDLLESPFPKERMEALKFCAQYGFGMPDKIVAVAALVKEEKDNGTSVAGDVLKAAVAILTTRVEEMNREDSASTDTGDRKTRTIDAQATVKPEEEDKLW